MRKINQEREEVYLRLEFMQAVSHDLINRCSLMLSSKSNIDVTELVRVFKFLKDYGGEELSENIKCAFYKMFRLIFGNDTIQKEVIDCFLDTYFNHLK